MFTNIALIAERHPSLLRKRKLKPDVGCHQWWRWDEDGPESCADEVDALLGSDDDDAGDGASVAEGMWLRASVHEPELCLAAKSNRLRRLCEQKPSGRCHVPDSIREQWEKGGHQRLALRDQLETLDWEKDWGRRCHTSFKPSFLNHHGSMLHKKGATCKSTLSSIPIPHFFQDKFVSMSSGKRKSSARPPMSSAGVGTRRTRWNTNLVGHRALSEL